MICAASWLAVGDMKIKDDGGKTVKGGEGSASVTARAIKWKAGFGSQGDEDWVCFFFFLPAVKSKTTLL